MSYLDFIAFRSCFVSVKHGLQCEPDGLSIESLCGSDVLPRCNYPTRAPAWLCVLLSLCASLPFCFVGFCFCLAGWLLGWLPCWLVAWLLGCFAGWLAVCMLHCLLASCVSLVGCWPGCLHVPICLVAWFLGCLLGKLGWLICCLAVTFLHDSSPACLHVSMPVFGLCFCELRVRI